MKWATADEWQTVPIRVRIFQNLLHVLALCVCLRSRLAGGWCTWWKRGFPSMKTVTPREPHGSACNGNLCGLPFGNNPQAGKSPTNLWRFFHRKIPNNDVDFPHCLLCLPEGIMYGFPSCPFGVIPYEDTPKCTPGAPQLWNVRWRAPGVRHQRAWQKIPWIAVRHISCSKNMGTRYVGVMWCYVHPFADENPGYNLGSWLGMFDWQCRGSPNDCNDGNPSGWDGQ